MTLAVQSWRVLYNANGSQTSFAIPQSFFSDSAIIVVKTRNPATDPPTVVTKTSGVDYNVTGTNVVFVSAPASGLIVGVFRVLDIKQDIDFDSNSVFPAESLETRLDKHAAIMQQLQGGIDRAIKVQDTAASGQLNFDIKEPFTAEALLAVNVAGTGIEMGPSASALAASQAAAAASASAAATSASAASTSASGAASSATAAASSATSAASSATAAAASATAAAALVADGDKGDIVVSSSGAAWNIDTGVLTAAGRALIDDADAAAQRTTLGLGTLATQSGTFSGTSSGTNTGDQTITLTGDVTGTGTGSFAATIAADAVDNTKAANMVQSTIKGRAAAAGTGDPTDLTATQATAILNAVVGDSGSGGTKGLVPAPAAGDAAASKFLKADATWATAGVAAHSALTGLTTGDDHTQYALLAGRSGGQQLDGGTAASDSLTLMSTANATKGKIIMGTSAYDEVNQRLGLRTTTPTSLCDFRNTTDDVFLGAPNIIGSANNNNSTYSLYANSTALYLYNKGYNGPIWASNYLGEMAIGLTTLRAPDAQLVVSTNSNLITGGASATAVPTVVIKKLASQTGDLQQWTDTDGTTILAKTTVAGKIFGTGLDATSAAITNVADPSGAQDAATKNYVDTTGKAIVQNSKSAAYTTVLADAGKHILHPSADTTARTITIDSNANVAYPIGSAITFVNQHSAGVMTIAITSDTMRLAGAGTTGSRTLAADGIATALKITSTEWIISGTGLS